jgi:ribose transport system substrate-binding protein
MKKTLAFVVSAVFLICLLTACAGTPAATPSTAASSAAPSVAPSPAESAQPSAPAASSAAASAEGKKKIILSNAYYTAPYCAAFNPSAEKKAQELGVELQILDGETNQQKQLEQAKMALTEAKAFIYFPADVDGSAPVIEALKGFPYLIVNNYSLDKAKELGVPCFVGTDVKQHGYNMADLLFKLFPDKKANLVGIEGVAGHAQTIAFNQAFDERFAGTEFKWLDKQNADFDADKAMAKMTDLLTKYGDKIQAIVCHDGGMLQGVTAALKAADKLGKIPIVCAGSNKNIYEAIKAGYVYGTSTQDPGVEGALAVETVVKIMNGEKVDQWVKLPIEPATKDTIDQFNWF